MSKTYEPTLHRNARGNGKSKELDVKPPKFHCNSCTKRVENRCTFFNRHIEPDLNKCYYHSNYSPVLASFKVQENLDELVEKEQEKLSA